MSFLWWLISFGFPVFVAACSTAPLTHRRQVILTSETQEIALGADQHRVALSRLTFSQNLEANRVVRAVGKRIAQAVNRPDYEWEFIVIDDATAVNAWVFPGGKVGVCTGFFPVAGDETGLAILLSHAVAHALARHQGEKASRDLFLEVGTMGVTFAPELLRQAYNVGNSLGIIMPFGQVQEMEADALGLLLAAKAGYNPETAIGVWQRVATELETRQQPMEFVSSHPDYGTRRQTIEQWLPEALVAYQQAPTKTTKPLPSLASFAPADEEERALLEQLSALDRIAVTSPRHKEAIVAALAQEFHFTPHHIEEHLRTFSLRPAELAFLLILAEASGEPLPALVTAVGQAQSWIEVATSYGVFLATVRSRLQAVETTSQELSKNPNPFAS
jgi:hypothetical protein